MLRFARVALAATALLGGAATPCAALPEVLGDLDANARISVADAVRLLAHQRGAPLLDAELRPFADLTRDGTSDPDDVEALLGALLGLRPATPFSVPLTTILTSPADGEEAVAVTRETIVRLSFPLASNEVVSPSDVFVSFDGTPRASTIVVSPDRTVITLFHPQLLPGAARVRLTVAGSGLMDAAGRAIDADGDGVAGGTAEIDFDTLGLTALPGTIACGRVFASELAPGPGGTSINVGLEGVHISVDGAPHLTAITDAMGSFRMDPAPAGRFFVHVDARPVQDGVPPGAYYPYVGKPWETVPGQETNVGDVYLPLVLPGTLQAVSTTSPTPIAMVDDYTDAHPELEGVSITVPADSLYADDGQRGGSVGIAPVPPDRLPGTLPEGLDFDLVITVQTDGATNFATPVPACFPTPTDPTTGELLRPGDKSTLWSFNHDAGRWEAIGAMTVTADGRLACTDPGVGIEQPGWHGTLPGYTASGGETVFGGGGGGGGEPVAEVAGYEPATARCSPAAPVCTACDAAEPGDGVPGGVTDPVNLFSGEMVLEEEDMRIPGVGLDFRWVRTYRSQVRLSTSMGNGWVHGYDVAIEEAGPDIRLIDGGSRQDIYRRQPDGTWGRPEVFRVLSREPDGRYSLAFADTSRWMFRPLDGSPGQGRIERIVDRHDNEISFAYDAAGRLATVTDTLGRPIQVEHDADGRVAVVRDYTGREVRYAYHGVASPGGAFGDLASVTSPAVVGTPNGNDFPSGRTRTYTYSRGFADDRLNHNLLTITDARRNDPADATFGQGPYLVNIYAGTQDPLDPLFDRVVRQQWGGGIVDLVYVAQAPSAANGFAVVKTIVNDRVGNVKELLYDASNRLVVMRELTGRAVPDQPTTETLNRPAGKLRPTDPDAFVTRYEYNADSLPSRVVYPNGTIAERIYEGDLDPDAPPASRGNLRIHRRLPGSHVPAGDQAAVETAFEYESGFGNCCGTQFVKRQVDPNGNATTYERDATGNVTRITHPVAGAVEEYEYDARGRMIAHVWPPDGEGRRRRDEITWHESGAQRGYADAMVMDAAGLRLTTRLEHDALGRVVAVHDARGASMQRVVNQLGEVVRMVSREVEPGTGRRHAIELAYDANGNVIREDVENRDAAGVLQPNAELTTTREHDILDRLVRIAQEVGPGEDVVQEVQYDLEGNVVLVRSGEAVAGRQPANVVRTLWDERNLPFRVIRAEGDPAQFTVQRDYDASGNVARLVTGLEGAPRVTQFAHDGFDRLVRVVDPMGNVFEHSYDPAGNVVRSRLFGEPEDVPGSAANVRLAEQSWTYDGLLRAVSSSRALFDPATQAPFGDGEITTSNALAPAGMVTSMTDDLGRVSTYVYDTAHRLVRTTDAAGNVVESELDENGLPVRLVERDVSDLGGPPRVFESLVEYDGLDRVKRVTDPAGGTASFGYDSRGNLVRATDALHAPGGQGNLRRSEYDGLSRLVREIIVLTSDGTGAGAATGEIAMLSEWDANSRLVARTDGNGNATRWTYDAADRPVVTQFPDGSMARSSFTTQGALAEVLDPNGSRMTYTNDLLDRVQRVDIVPGSGVAGTTLRLDHVHDGAGNLVRAANDVSVIERRWDSASRLLAETVDGFTVSYAHDSVGNVLSRTLTGGHVTSWTHDALNRPRTMSDGSGLLASWDWAGDVLERRTLANGTRTLYEHDALKRPTRIRHETLGGAAIDDRTFAWDAVSRLASRTDALTGAVHAYAYDSASRMVESSLLPGGPSLAYVLDAANNRLSVVGGPDAGTYAMSAGADAGGNRYTTTPFDARRYDARGNLLSAARGPGDATTFEHDALARLVTATLPGGTLRYEYDALGRRIARTTPSGEVTRFVHDDWRVVAELDGAGATRSTWATGLGIDDALARQDAMGERWFHSDFHGSVFAVSDGIGNVLERVDYADFGLPSFRSPAGDPLGASAIGNDVLFQGLRFDRETGLLHARMRELDPRAGRFIQHDPVGAWGDPMALGNPHAFVGNNPWSAADPYGLGTYESMVGGLGIVGGSLMLGAAYLAGPFGIPLGIYAYDYTYASASQMFSGREHNTYFQQGVAHVTGSQRVGHAADMAVSLLGPAGTARMAARCGFGSARFATGAAHLANEASVAGITASGRLSGGTGIFTLAPDAVPATVGMRTLVTTVRGATSQVNLPARIHGAVLATPPMTGLTSSIRGMLGWRVLPPGTLKLGSGRFLANKVLDIAHYKATGAIRYINLSRSYLVYARAHQWVIDYGVDGAMVLGTMMNRSSHLMSGPGDDFGGAAAGPGCLPCGAGGAASGLGSMPLMVGPFIFGTDSEM